MSGFLPLCSPDENEPEEEIFPIFFPAGADASEFFIVRNRDISGRNSCLYL